MATGAVLQFLALGVLIRALLSCYCVCADYDCAPAAGMCTVHSWDSCGSIVDFGLVGLLRQSQAFPNFRQRLAVL